MNDILEPTMLAEESTDRTGFRIWRDGVRVLIGMNNVTLEIAESDFYVFTRLVNEATRKLMGLEEVDGKATEGSDGANADSEGIVSQGQSDPKTQE